MAPNMKTMVTVLNFDQENIQLYINELTMWQLVTEVEKKKQSPLVWMSLPKTNPSNIKKSISDSIGMDDLGKEHGIDRLIKALKDAFLDEEEIETFSK